jgi:NAD(P)-dependent dehydrogenase (short-subunit alcohol dehydrogenase family)
MRPACVDAADQNEPMEKVVLITGASRGIGAATALAAARAGYAVGIVYRERAEAADQVLRQCVASGSRAVTVAADVSVGADVARAFATVEEALGPITALVNNAGALATQSRVVDLSAERIEWMLRVNVVSAFLCAQEAVRRMSTASGGAGGAIVNVGSRAGVIGGANEYVDYAAAKAAVDTLTVGLAKEVAREGVRVNGVRPGLIDTDIHASGGEPTRIERLRDTVPLGRGGEPEEVAAAIMWLLSDEASYVTGTLLDVSGGR